MILFDYLIISVILSVLDYYCFIKRVFKLVIRNIVLIFKEVSIHFFLEKVNGLFLLWILFKYI